MQNSTRIAELVEGLKENPLNAEEQVRCTKEILRSGGDPLRVLMQIVAIFEPESMLAFLESIPVAA